MFARLDQIAIQIIKMLRPLFQRLGQFVAHFDIGLNAEYQFLHAGILMAAPDDLKRLHQRHAGRHHGRQLAAEDRYIGGFDLGLRAQPKQRR